MRNFRLHAVTAIVVLFLSSSIGYADIPNAYWDVHVSGTTVSITIEIAGGFELVSVDCPPGVTVPLNNPDTVAFTYGVVQNGPDPEETYVRTEFGERQSCEGGHGGISNRYRATMTYTDTVPGNRIYEFKLSSFNFFGETDSVIHYIPYTINPNGVVWVEDGWPYGATYAGDNDTWNWINSTPSPFSGLSAHQSSVVDGSWEHRAYWGANLIEYGVDGTAGQRYMGLLPAAGEWGEARGGSSTRGARGEARQRDVSCETSWNEMAPV
jgi:hypothetical protein